MKLNLLALLALPAVMYSQKETVTMDSLKTESKYPNTFTSGSPKVEKFNNKARLFNDWAISVGGGTALMHYADLTSFYGNKINWGWNSYVSLDKQITHTFGLSLQYQQGETNQKAMLKEEYGVGIAKTKYRQVSILGDINFSNLLRRIDNHSPYRWALHGYAGIGVEGFDTKLTDSANKSDKGDWFVTKGGTMHQDLGIASFFYQGGVGLKYKISRIVDLEARVMYIITGDDEFDGGGDANASTNEKIGYTHSDYPYNSIKKNNSDNFLTANLGLTFNLGKHLSHLTWHDPLQETFYRVNLLENRKVDLNVCEKGDLDNDGVCDDWDRQLDTPAGARVDGAGVALDTDLDGVIDLNDKCVTVAGSVENEGCPVVETSIPSMPATHVAPSLNKAESVKEINKNFEGIEFALNKDIIKPISFSKLDNAASIIKTLNEDEKYLVVGATDTRGGDAYNLNLSQRRADAVVKYLVGKGVNPSMLTAEGRGKNDLKYPECNPASKCPEWKNEANRRVYFIEK